MKGTAIPSLETRRVIDSIWLVDALSARLDGVLGFYIAWVARVG